MINNREKGKLSLSLKKGENLGRTDTIITGREGIILSSRCQITIRWSKLYSENPCIKSWKRLRMNPSSNGPIRWWETLKRETEISIVNTIETTVTLLRIAEVYGITWTNSSENPMTRDRSSLALFGSWQSSSRNRRATDIILEGHDPILPGAAKIMLIVPRGGREGFSLSGRVSVWPTKLLEWCNNYFNLPS